MYNKRNNRTGLLLRLMVGLFLVSCNQIIEKDITGVTPTIILPQANDTLQSNPIHFKWNAVEGATKYHLEIVTPSFSNIAGFTLDSIVTGTQFYVSLDSNQYEFRLTALNGAYQSKPTSPLPFVVGTSMGSNPTAVILNAPAANAYANALFSGQFSWFTLPGANSYTFELHEGNSFAGPTLQFLDQIGTNSINSFNGAALGEGTYTWGIKAFLSNGVETVYSKRTFYIDTVPPGDAILNSPANNNFENAGTILFSWTLPSDAGIVQSPVRSILEISTNASFTAMLAPDTVTGNSFSKNLSAGTYYWRVKTLDLAGNAGSVPASSFVLTVLP